MFLHLRTWKGSWFGSEPVVRTRPFGHSENPPPEVFGFAVGLWQDAAAAHPSRRTTQPRPSSIRPATPSSG
jgi:hypothetical protein